jgi:EAL domain-containing protein (putative c-di-GMP-specific phosphodiesterase class I)
MPSELPAQSPAGRCHDAKRAAAELRRTERDLDAAIRDEAFVLHYQPRVALATGRVIGAEAQLRCRHGTYGLLAPAGRLPAAERSGRITAINAWTLGAACREATLWPAHTLLSVNIAARQFIDRTLLAQVAAALDESGLEPERLELELTEAMLADDSVHTLLALASLRDLGIGLTLDDFGAGAAGLPMLKRLPLSAVKLDRALVRELPQDRDDVAIVHATIAAAHGLGLGVMADGIETAGQFALLRRAGCDEGQGLLFGRPVPADPLRSQFGQSSRPSPPTHDRPPPAASRRRGHSRN